MDDSTTAARLAGAASLVATSTAPSQTSTLLEELLSRAAPTTIKLYSAEQLAGSEHNNNLSSASLQEGSFFISEEDELKLLNFPSKREDLSTAIPLTVIFALLLVTGCIGNMCTAIVIARPKNKYMHTATNYYLFSLAMSDFLFLILGLPQEMYTLWQRYPYAFGESFCIIRGYLSEASTYASILTISAFTVERYVAICHPLWAHTMSQLSRAIKSIVIIWILAAICAIPPAAELGIIMQTGPISNRTLEQSAQCATKRTIYENMFVVSAIVFFIVPMIIVTVLYILIALELRRSSKMNGGLSGHHQTSGQLTASLSGSGPQNHRQHRQHHHRQLQLERQQRRLELERPLPAEEASLQRLLSGEEKSAAAEPADSWKLRSQSQRELAPVGAGGSSLSVTSQRTVLPEEELKGTASALNGHLTSAERPSSAIGNERLASQSAGHFRPTPLSARLSGAKTPGSLWPLFGQLAPRRSAGLPGDGQQPCQCQRQLQQTQSQQLATAGPATCSPDSLALLDSARHSPLSYHESFIQHQQSQKQPTQAELRGRQEASTSEQANKASKTSSAGAKLHPFPIHQMSLVNLPTFAASNGPSAGVSANSITFGQQSAARHPPTTCCHHGHHYNPAGSQPGMRSAVASRRSVIRMLVAVVVSFFICWVPFHAQRLLASYLVKDENQNQLLLDIYLKLTYISGVMYYLSSTINPLLYQLMSAKFRLAFKETFKCSLFKCASLAGRTRTPNNSPTNSLKENNNNNTNTSIHRRCATCNQNLMNSRQVESSRTSFAGNKLQREFSTHAAPSQECSCLNANSSNLNKSTEETDNNVLSPPTNSQSCEKKPASYLATLKGRLDSFLGRLFRQNSSSKDACCCFYKYQLIIHK